MLSIVTALYNKREISQAFYASLLAYPPPEPWEMIWIDDASTDDTREWLAALPGNRHRILLNERNRGYAFSNNRGAKAARGTTLGFLNNDLLLTPGWCDPMLAALNLFPNAGLVGNVQLNARTGAVDHSGIYYYARGRPTHDRTLPPRTTPYRPVIATTGACVLMRSADFRASGGFDECFVNGSEDIDLCLRARAAGFQNLVALDSVVHHHVSASPGRSLHNQRNAFHLMRRWQSVIPDLTAESWTEPLLRDRWESKLTGLAWLAARLSRRFHRDPDQPCPSWMRRSVVTFVDRQLNRWQREFPNLSIPSPPNSL